MKCMHCLIEFHKTNRNVSIGNDADGNWFVSCNMCPACNRLNLFLHNPQINIPIRPLGGSNRPPCPSEVPSNIADDYKEACLVLPFSPKASAALSRRCLQTLLRTSTNIKHGNLANEIQQVIDSKTLPQYLIEVIDAIRNIGNFAAHPIKSTNSGEILPVESEEAEWNLDVLESLFDFYYIQPAKTKLKRDKLNVKLQEAGKPQMK
ncbi:MAG: DUF4145 domain-containing protein [Anaerolineaceae bacterium]|nr:DUF4145 domain-containing protein [Anaerolineaceae bacterium]